MTGKIKAARKTVLQPRLRIYCGKDIALGPGKADLLEHLQATGSISLAAEKMGLSYMRAWTLIKMMNRCFSEPLVLALRGGSQGGGAKLSELGEEVLTLYRQMEAKSFEATRADWQRLQKNLR